MTKVLTAQLTHISENEQKVFYLLVVLFVFLSALYGVFVKQTVVHVVEREKIQKEVRALNTEVGDLEALYMAKKSEMTLEYAYAQGFLHPEKTEYVGRKTLSRTDVLSRY